MMTGGTPILGNLHILSTHPFPELHDLGKFHSDRTLFSRFAWKNG